MSATVLKLILLGVELVMMLIRRQEKEEHEKRVAAIRRDPRAAFRNKFGRVRNPAAPSTSDLYDAHPPAVKRDGERTIVD